MDEISVSDIQAYMGGRAAVAEIDDITGLHFIVRDIIAVLELCRCGAVDAVAKLAEDILHKAGTVKTGGT